MKLIIRIVENRWNISLLLESIDGKKKVIKIRAKISSV